MRNRSDQNKIEKREDGRRERERERSEISYETREYGRIIQGGR
jgi:hypothetical protein